MLTLVTLIPAAAQAAEPDSVTFGVQPATATAPDPRPFLSYGVTPGARVKDHVAVLNYSGVPLPLTVYASDAITADDGGFGLLPGNERPTDVGAWISLGAPTVDVVVPPRTAEAPGSVILPVSIAVPADASPGDHVGGVTAVLSTVDESRDGPSVRLDQRVVTRVYARVAGDLRPELTVENLRATYQGVLNPIRAGVARVTYTVRNTGNVKLGGEQQVAIRGLAGPSVIVNDLDDLPLLPPGGSIDVTADASGVWPSFRLTADVLIKPGGLAGDANPELNPVKASVSFWAFPWTLMALLVAVLLAAGWFVRRRRRPTPPTTRGRHSNRVPQPTAPYSAIPEVPAR
jgi:hypothetical protein